MKINSRFLPSTWLSLTERSIKEAKAIAERFMHQHFPGEDFSQTGIKPRHPIVHTEAPLVWVKRIIRRSHPRVVFRVLVIDVRAGCVTAMGCPKER